MKIHIIGRNSSVTDKYLQHLKQAFVRISSFLSMHKLPHVDLEDLLQEVFIFENHKQFSAKLSSVLNVAESEILPNHVGTIINKSLYIMDQQYYSNQHPEQETNTSYQKLITHELTHQYHIFFLNGNEDHMGPVWFYEGFACSLADQFNDSKTSFSLKEIHDAMFSTKRVSYNIYKVIFDICMEEKSVLWLLHNAHKENFTLKMYHMIETKFNN